MRRHFFFFFPFFRVTRSWKWQSAGCNAWVDCWCGRAVNRKNTCKGLCTISSSLCLSYYTQRALFVECCHRPWLPVILRGNKTDPGRESGKTVPLMSVATFACSRVFTNVAIFLSMALCGIPRLISGELEVSVLATQNLSCSKTITNSVLKGYDILEKNAWHWKSHGLTSTFCKAYYEVLGKTSNVHLMCVKFFSMNNCF